MSNEMPVTPSESPAPSNNNRNIIIGVVVAVVLCCCCVIPWVAVITSGIISKHSK